MITYNSKYRDEWKRGKRKKEGEKEEETEKEREEGREKRKALLYTRKIHTFFIYYIIRGEIFYCI